MKPAGLGSEAVALLSYLGRGRRKISTASRHGRDGWGAARDTCISGDGPARVLAISRQCFAEMCRF